MTSNRTNSSLAVAAGGLFAFVVLVSGVWHPKAPAGGLTQVGRHASVAFEDGSVLELSESETDQGILKRRRMAGWGAHDYRQTFVMSDGREMEVLGNRPSFKDDEEGLSSGDRLMLIANTRETDSPAALGDNDSAVVADLQVNGKEHVIAKEVDGKDNVIADVIDGKDRHYIDYKDAKDPTPVFALSSQNQSLDDERLDFMLMFGGGYWNDIRTASSTGTIDTGSGGNITTPPIGVAVPEPSALPWLGVAGAVALAFKVWQRRKSAA